MVLRPRGHASRADALSKRFARLRRAAGLPHGVTAYALRNSFASSLLAQNAPLPDVAEALGHSTPTARHYLHALGDRREHVERREAAPEAAWHRFGLDGLRGFGRSMEPGLPGGMLKLVRLPVRLSHHRQSRAVRVRLSPLTARPLEYPRG